MKGVILAGGLGTRLYPLTHATNKHLLPVFDQPMIYYPIQTLVRAGVKNIMVVTGGPHAGDFIRVLQNGEDFGIEHLEYAYQESGEGGIADALRLCENFADGSSITVILGDNCTDANISNDNKVFDYPRKIKPSKRGQLEITDVNNLYLKDGNLDWSILHGFWSDAGTPESLYRASVYWARKILGRR